MSRLLCAGVVAAALLTAGCTSNEYHQQGGTNVNCGDTAECGNNHGNNAGGRTPDPTKTPSDTPSPSPSDSDSASRTSSPTPTRTRTATTGRTPTRTPTRGPSPTRTKAPTDLSAYPTATLYANGAPLFRVVWVETPKNEVEFTGVGRTQIRERGAEGVGYHMRLPSTSTFRVNGSGGSLDYAFVGSDSRLLHVRNPGTCTSGCAALNPTRDGTPLPYTTILQIPTGRLSTIPAGALMTYRLD
ncbi:hypothetical protein [Streptomyces sp. NPDC048606]|uniref:hypothetical protein n=1 Tax=Streptomyces sp. NPDC048606 TaxID=3154726 RepID=UPI0034287952